MLQISQCPGNSSGAPPSWTSLERPTQLTVLCLPPALDAIFTELGRIGGKLALLFARPTQMPQSLPGASHQAQLPGVG